MQKLVYFIFFLLALIPLPILQGLGSVLGRLGFYFATSERQRTTKNLHFSKLAANDQQAEKLVKSIFAETAKSGLELSVAWTRSSKHIVSLFKEVHGWEHIEAAIERNEGLLLITPHLGNYDLAGRFLSEKLPFPLTAMYRPPKISWLENVMNSGRVRDNGYTAPANMLGVKQIVRALKNKQATIVLPDQVPGEGEGVWATFFGQPAYTMTLASRLAVMPEVTPLFFCGERLPHGRGFVLHIAPLEGTLSGNREHDAQIINNNVEKWVRRFPSQYLFGYNRYKHRGNKPPESSQQSQDMQPPVK
ncbi:lysophospholipid acyltransferase family protein [Snodgrassella sp. ESL0323]|uniref:lysophospholipid acyltransferase family protein n=1 Tax=Snodgrassella sp. ESL0323 TaxID=2705034 RepID=UPI001581B772|nr:lysophospholipid acyltransferase family protein [Snodgrassella sp. ESL0323]NUF77406.1 lysophospholipid acyltransferase family protein [Snodgrassella sp. ESL0323]